MLLSLLLQTAAPTAPQQAVLTPVDPPVDLVGEGRPQGWLTVRVLDAATQAPMPARLTFTAPDGAVPELFRNFQAAPRELAVRKDVVNTLRGVARISVPAGTWKVHASRGPEWSLATRELTVAAGASLEWTAALTREVDTAGWIASDNHLHTLTHSGHGDANLEERVLTLIAEGVEFAVATDHNHLTDYRPTLEALGALGRMGVVTGNEVSTPIGHFNTFPLDPTRGPIDAKLSDAGALFRLARAEPNAFGTVPVVQLNHPRYTDIDWFGQTALDPVTGRSSSPRWSDDFDTLEVLNANPCFGLANAELTLDEAESQGSVLTDWFHLLNLGRRYAAVGNSDSHTVRFDFAGWPRTYVRSSTDDPARLEVRELADNQRAARMTISFGPFLELEAQGQGLGSQVRAEDGQVELRVRLQAASWIDVDRVEVLVNGDVVRELAVPAARTPLRLDQRLTLPLHHDAWVVLRAAGDAPLAPVLPSETRVHRPAALTNPIWIDADGDGVWTAPWDTALNAARHCDALDEARAVLALRLDFEAALFVLACHAAERPFAAELARLALARPAREMQMTCCAIAAQRPSPALAEALAAAARPDEDLELALWRIRALRAAGRGPDQTAFLRRLAQAPEHRRLVHRELILTALAPRWVDAWKQRADVVPSPRARPLLDAPPTTGAGTAAGVPAPPLVAQADGSFELGVGLDKAQREDALYVLTTQLHAPSARSVGYALGTDDQSRLFLGGRLIVQDDGAHDAAARHFGVLELQQGWNTIELRVQNGGGRTGFRFGITDPDVRWSTEPR